MSERSRPRKAVTLSELVADVLAPVRGRRGFVLADLAAAWPEIAGSGYAECTEPVRIDWPRAAQGGDGVLRLRAEGPRAVLLQHELGQLMERVNVFFGHRAIDRIRLEQGPLQRRRHRSGSPPPPEVDEERLADAVGTVNDARLRAALAHLGRGVFTRG
jgi:hypothetical protein